MEFKLVCRSGFGSVDEGRFNLAVYLGKTLAERRANLADSFLWCMITC